MPAAAAAFAFGMLACLLGILAVIAQTARTPSGSERLAMLRDAFDGNRAVAP